MTCHLQATYLGSSSQDYLDTDVMEAQFDVLSTFGNGNFFALFDVNADRLRFELYSNGILNWMPRLEYSMELPTPSSN